MAFVLSQKTTFTWPIHYETPKDNGKYEKANFVAEFNRLPQSRLDDLAKQAGTDGVNDDDVIDEILVGWSGIKTPDGEDVEFNEVNKRIVLDLPGMRAAIVLAFFDAVSGGRIQRIGRKN